MEANTPSSSLPKRRVSRVSQRAAITLLVAGCATVTPEQAARRELLLQAAQECQRRYPFISRFEFDRFDRLLWFYREGTGQTDRNLFISCYNERVAELVKTATPTAGAAPAQPPTSVDTGAWREAPVWKLGDEWSYRWESPRGAGTFVWRVASQEIVDGIDCYVIDSGRYEIFFRKTDLAMVQQKNLGRLEYAYKPPRAFVSWPLQVGRTWEQLYVQEWPQERSTSNRLRVWHVEAKERITVPAGAFETFKIVERNKWTNAVVVESWAAPEVKGMVRVHLYFDYGVEKRDLTAFKLN